MFLPIRKYNQSNSFANINEYYSYLYKDGRYLSNFKNNIDKKMNTCWTIDDIADIPISNLNKKQYCVDLKRRDILTNMRFSNKVSKMRNKSSVYVNVDNVEELDDAYKLLECSDVFIIRISINMINELLPLGTIWIEPWSDDDTILIYGEEFELMYYDNIILEKLQQYHNFQRWAIMRENGDRCNDCALEEWILFSYKLKRKKYDNYIDSNVPIHTHFVQQCGQFHTPIC